MKTRNPHKRFLSDVKIYELYSKYTAPKDERKTAKQLAQEYQISVGLVRKYILLVKNDELPKLIQPIEDEHNYQLRVEKAWHDYDVKKDSLKVVADRYDFNHKTLYKIFVDINGGGLGKRFTQYEGGNAHQNDAIEELKKYYGDKHPGKLKCEIEKIRRWTPEMFNFTEYTSDKAIDNRTKRDVSRSNTDVRDNYDLTYDNQYW